jgi:hypothetical protein
MPVTYQPVAGIDSLNRAFGLAGKGMSNDLKTRLRHFARPVELGAEVRAIAMGTGRPWSQMRTGANRQLVYVAPEKRGTKILARRRPRFAVRLLEKSMVPALNASREQIVRDIDGLVERMERRYLRGL